ncbi:MAG: outer membrane lipoprotein carrier protein LolA [Bacteroidia bacterium]|nr:outer membrane lipoprotein carrier protein LolA [Bacteroidia bacterium]
MKKITILAALIYFTSVSFAQQKDKDQKPVHDAKAKEILDKVSAKTKAYKTIKADFVINREDKKDVKKSNTQKGTIWIKGSKYKLDVLGTITYCDGKTRWAYIKESKEINITEPDKKTDNLVDPTKVFTIYEKGYKYKFMYEKFEDGLQLYEIDLYPETVEKIKVSRITLQIEKNENRLHCIKYVEKDGVTVTVKIAKFSPDAEISDAEVTFNKANFPGAEIIDMRD